MLLLLAVLLLLLCLLQVPVHSGLSHCVCGKHCQGEKTVFVGADSVPVQDGRCAVCAVASTAGPVATQCVCGTAVLTVDVLGRHAALVPSQCTIHHVLHTHTMLMVVVPQGV
jgi:hypothetical protein